MALSSAGPYLDVVDILRKLQKIGFCSDLDVPPQEASCGSLSSLFDRILSAFWKEVNRGGEIRQLPPMVGVGCPVDLLRLYSSVQDMGGYHRVTENCAWTSVAQAIGLEWACGSALKLVFFKYFDALDRWLQRVSGKKIVGERPGYKSLDHSDDRSAYGAIAEHKNADCQPLMPSGLKKDQFLSPMEGSGCRTQIDTNGNDNDNSMTSGTRLVHRGINHQKRKQEALEGMLNWVRNLAKSPNCCYVRKCSATENVKGKGLVPGDQYPHALLARQALFLKRIRRSSPEADDDQKKNPSICVNGDGTISQKGLEFECQRQAVGEKSQTCHEMFRFSNDHKDKGQVGRGETNNDVKNTLQSSSLDTTVGWLSDDQLMEIPVGGLFQAKVPIWTGQPSVSSGDLDQLKWLGTRSWPPEGQENKLLFDKDDVGRGRKDSCQCLFHGSLECIRFHIAEKRLQLKRELGPAFHAWGFRSMGEEVSLSWTEGEELKFKAIVTSNRPSMDKDFWDELYLYFPYRKRQSLVSYYFNVFLLGCRRYQNRVTHNIDSDDDEMELGISSNPFGQGRIKIHDSFPIICTQNMECMDLDE